MQFLVLHLKQAERVGGGGVPSLGDNTAANADGAPQALIQLPVQPSPIWCWGETAEPLLMQRGLNRSPDEQCSNLQANRRKCIQETLFGE